jgi:UDP-3-O-[3-hydroxymyristoyl] N-acetylglucosamine deacetylase/3-hydroxyacyl-[acyl-carrier-protein] dehydratase
MSEPRNPFPRLPHAAPFLLLDRVLDVDDKAGTFLKLVSAADPCVAPDGHLPAAFVLEALAQAGGALLTAQRGGPTAGYLVAVDEFRTHGDVRVGDALHLEVAIVRTFGVTVVFRGRALVAGEVRAEARFTLSPPR